MANSQDEYVSGIPVGNSQQTSAVEQAVLRDLQEPAAWVGGALATDVLDISHDPRVLDTSGRWVVAIDFDGKFTAVRFGSWRGYDVSLLPDTWVGPEPQSWRSSLSEKQYRAAVDTIRSHISDGTVYQVNLCRVLSAELPLAAHADPLSLARHLYKGNPAPYLAAVRVPEAQLMLASASPELYLARNGQKVRSRPIKGTAPPEEPFLDKDSAENVMIVDLVRNDFGVVAEPGSVAVPDFLVTEEHPGLRHLVSTVTAQLRDEVTWGELLAATFPPGSVTGAPKLSALKVIAELEPAARGPYCGALGWVDVDTGRAELCVAIRTFWLTSDDQHHGHIHFGTGAGITWGSDAELEWHETELKAARLVSLASRGSNHLG